MVNLNLYTELAVGVTIDPIRGQERFRDLSRDCNCKHLIPESTDGLNHVTSG